MLGALSFHLISLVYLCLFSLDILIQCGYRRVSRKSRTREAAKSKETQQPGKKKQPDQVIRPETRQQETSEMVQKITDAKPAMQSDLQPPKDRELSLMSCRNSADERQKELSSVKVINSQMSVDVLDFDDICYDQSNDTLYGIDNDMFSVEYNSDGSTIRTANVDMSQQNAVK